MKRLFPSLVLAALLSATLCTAAHAAPPLPIEFKGADIKERLGEFLDANIPVFDEEGDVRKIGDYFDGETPVLLTLNYFRCEGICTTQLNQLLRTLKTMDWVPGKEFRIVTVSFDPRDTPEIAKGKRKSYVDALGKGDDVSWSFLTARPKAIAAITAQLGYGYKYDESSGQYAHSPVVYVLGADRLISRYVYGLTYNARDIEFSVIDASNGRVGTLGDKILLSCFVFDPEHGGYAFAWGFMRIGGALVALTVGLWLLFWWRRERRHRVDETSPRNLLETAT